MPTDYEKVYQEKRHAFGEPANELVAFFNKLPAPARILDVGCGQGRDALFIARLGHQVVGIDLSATGIRQLQEDADREGLHIQGIVANIVEYQPEDRFDVILFDRTLHMLSLAERIDVLKRYIEHVHTEGYVFINDQKKNLAALENVFRSQHQEWMTRKKQRGLLLVQRTT